MQVFVCDLCGKRVRMSDFNCISFFPKFANIQASLVKAKERFEVCDDCFNDVLAQLKAKVNH